MLTKKCFNFKNCFQTVLVDDTILLIKMPTGPYITPNYKGVMICQNCRKNTPILKAARQAQSQHPGFEWMKEKQAHFDG